MAEEKIVGVLQRELHLTAPHDRVAPEDARHHRAERPGHFVEVLRVAPGLGRNEEVRVECGCVDRGLLRGHGSFRYTPRSAARVACFIGPVRVARSETS